MLARIRGFQVRQPHPSLVGQDLGRQIGPSLFAAYPDQRTTADLGRDMAIKTSEAVMSRRRSSGPHALFAWTVLGFLVLGSAANAVIRVTQSDVIEDPREWTSVILFSAGERYCSSTVVGARVVLTAAHCITGGERAITAWVKGDTATAQYEMKCEIHPKFDSNPAADYAL